MSHDRVPRICSQAESPLTPRCEKALQQLRPLFFANHVKNFWAVVNRRLAEQSRAVQHRPALGVAGSKIEPCDARMGYRASAHSAWFQRHKQVASIQPFIAQSRRSSAHGHDFGMGGGVVQFAGPVLALANDHAVLDDDGANGHFTCISGESGQVQRMAHGFGKRKWRHVLTANPLTNLRQADKRAPLPAYPC